MSKRAIYNTSGFSEAEIAGFPKLGTFNNNWRGRRVTVHTHPTDAAHLVVTVGVGDSETVIACEDRPAYAQRIDCNDWSDYN